MSGIVLREGRTFHLARFGGLLDGRPSPRAGTLPARTLYGTPVRAVKAPIWESMARYFGDKLRYLRIEHGIVQTELARRLHLATHTHVSQLESHRTTPSLNLVVRVALVFGVAIDYLIRDNLPVEEPVQFGHPKAVIAEVHWHHFGAKVRFQRQCRKLTQLQMSRALALGTQAHISHLESNRKEPSIDLVVRIADLFGVTTDYLLRDDVAVEGIDAQGE